MATLQKKGKKAKAKAPKQTTVEQPKDEPEVTRSVISVKEAEEGDKTDTIEEIQLPDEGKDETPPADLDPQPGPSEPPPSSAALRPGSVSPRPGSAASRPRSASPRPGSATPRGVKKNAVEPVGGDLGSTLSLKSKADDVGSVVSVRSKEAWVDTEVKPASRAQSAGSKAFVSPVINISEAKPENKIDSVGPNQDSKSQVSRSTTSLLSPPEMNESHAYVPYIYARDCIAKVVNDMKNMKTYHIKIVHDIEANYLSIENETQAQFNAFVLGLRQEYRHKVKLFRNVIEVHRLELDSKQTYWDESLTSFSDRNRNLLADKKALLIQNKVEFDRLEKEKEIAVTELMHKLDESNAEKKIISDQLESEKEETERLRKIIEELRNRPETAAAVAAVTMAIPEEPREVRTKDASVQADAPVTATAAATGAAMVVTDLSEDERKRMEEERRKMVEEREQMTEERAKMDEDRDKFAAERRRFQEEKVMLQGELNTANKDKTEWQTKYESLRGQLGELAELQAKYEALQAQFAAVVAVTSITSEEDKKKADETLKQAQNDKEIMMEEKHNIEKDINKFEEDFKKKNGREPTESERPENVKELYVQKEEADTMVMALDAKIDTVEQLQQGKVPEAPQVEAKPIVIAEPEIRTVEVKVPDPEVLAQLEMTQAEVVSLQKQLMEMKNENSKLQDDLSSKESEIAKLQAEIAKLQATIKALEGQLAAVGSGAAVVPVVVADEKTEGVDAALHAQMKADFEKQLKEKEKEFDRQLKEKEKEKKMVEKDIKKLLKQQAKQQKTGSKDEAYLRVLLQTVILQTKQIHSEAKKAAEKVDARLKTAEEGQKKEADLQTKAKKEYQSWEHGYTEEYGKEPKAADRDNDGKKLHEDLEAANKKLTEAETLVAALTMMKTGVIPEQFAVALGTPVVAMDTGASTEEIDKLEQKISDLEDKISELEEKNSSLTETNEEQEERIQELESQLAEAQVVGAGVGVATAMAVTASADVEGLGDQLTDLQKQVDKAEADLREEKTSHEGTQEELEALKRQLVAMQTELENEKGESEAKIGGATAKLEAELKNTVLALEQTKARTEELEKARLENVPVDTKKEINDLKAKLAKAEKERDESKTTVVTVTAQMKESQTKVDSLDKTNKAQKKEIAELQAKLKEQRAEKDKQLKQLQGQMDKKEKQRAAEEKKKLTALEQKIKELQQQKGGAPVAVAAAGRPGTRAGDGKAEAALKEKLQEANRENREMKERLKQMQQELKAASASAGPSLEEKQQQKKQEKILKELEKKYENEKKKAEKNEENLKKRDEELKESQKEAKEKDEELKKLKMELSSLGVAAKEGLEAAAKVKALEKDVKKLSEENKTLAENFNSERVLRKKYYNMVEDMKGKIRVYCRARPLSSSEKERGNFSVVKSPDEYTITVDSQRGTKEFQFDSIFMPEHSQEKVFEDTNNLIQSAVDGYNVCIFAYGQTGSGKTYTIIGDTEQKTPGIAPRAFNRIFELLNENKKKFSYDVTVYMLELYNDKLLDLFAKPGTSSDDKLDIKKDKKGLVFVQGSEVKKASNAKELFALFEEGSKNRHTASTKMNAESSRSHLVVGIIIETTNKTSGAVMKGKLSLVDLAGSERAAKTGATAEQLKEAMSINKSLSALGDVISALSSEQSFIPYRNNKLTMLMQDSLGGNAKTLMFVNISPADYNQDESIISLTYASRVKLITNDASKNADNKEIARLKGVIAKLKKGEAVEEEAAAD